MTLHEKLRITLCILDLAIEFENDKMKLKELKLKRENIQSFLKMKMEK